VAVYVFHGAQLQLDDARKVADKCQQQQESLSAQLQGKNNIYSILHMDVMICSQIDGYQWIRETYCLDLDDRTFIVIAMRTLGLSYLRIIRVK
jgi:hypothetical protein